MCSEETLLAKKSREFSILLDSFSRLIWVRLTAASLGARVRVRDARRDVDRLSFEKYFAMPRPRFSVTHSLASKMSVREFVSWTPHFRT